MVRINLSYTLAFPSMYGSWQEYETEHPKIIHYELH